MFNQFDKLDDLIKFANKQTQEYQEKLQVLDELMAGVLKNAPDKDKTKISEIQGLMQRTINLAKAGKLSEAQAEIKEFEKIFKDERKNSK